MRSTFVICVASVAVSLVSAQNKASITYFQDPGCRNSSTTVVQVTPNECQNNAQGASYIVKCSGGGGSIQFCSDTACKSCIGPNNFQNNQCIALDGSGAPAPGGVESAILVCPNAAPPAPGSPPPSTGAAGSAGLIASAIVLAGAAVVAGM